MFADSDSAHVISFVVVSRMSAFPFPATHTLPSRRATQSRDVGYEIAATFFTPIVMLGLFCDSTGRGLTTGL